MAHESEQEIKCPYCNYEFEDSWEYNDEDSVDVDCPHCDKEFTLNVSVTVDYSTYRKDCQDEKHSFGEWEESIVDQETCDRWNRTNFLDRTDHVPFKRSERQCNNCEEYESKKSYDLDN